MTMPERIESVDGWASKFTRARMDDGSPVRGWRQTILAAVVLGSVSACASAGLSQGQPAGSGGDRSVAAAEQGEQLTAVAAAGLEKSLRATPGDLNTREQLVGYYFIAQATDIQSAGKPLDPNGPTVARDRHLVWLIRNSPALELLGTNPIGVVQPTPDAADYAAAKDAWSRQVGGQAPPQVKGNAGIFFAQTGDPRAVDLLTTAEAGDSGNPNWPAVLGDLYVLKAKSAPPGSPGVQQAAALAVGEMEKAWNLSGSSTRDPRLSEIAKLAVIAGQDDKAVRYATGLINTFQAGAGQSPLTVGGPIHDGNMVLGQVALRKGDRAGAEQFLLKAGATPGSPLMNQFGPNFSLARDLLMVGSTNVVLKYCDEVSKFWSDPKLAAWRAAIAAGKTPDFGDNLWY
jgi:hypothetical protein